MVTGLQESFFPSTPRPGREGVKNLRAEQAPSGPFPCLASQAESEACCFFFSLLFLLAPFFFFLRNMSLAITHVLIIIMTICLMGCNKTTANLAPARKSLSLPHPYLASQPACP